MTSPVPYIPPPSTVHVAGAAPGDGWQYVASLRARAAGDHKGRSVVRWSDDGTGVVGAELVGVALCLLVMDHETHIRVNASAATNAHVVRLAAGEDVYLPARFSHLRDRFRMVTEVGASPWRAADPRLKVVDRLEEALAGQRETQSLDQVVQAIETSKAALKRQRDHLTGFSAENGFTADYTNRNGQGVCAFVETRSDSPVGSVVVVRLPEAIAPASGEMAASLLAFLHARSRGCEEPVIFSDSEGTVQVLRSKGSRTWFKYVRTAPLLVRSLLLHSEVEAAREIRASWVPRYSTPAQAATDQVARQAADGHLQQGAVELPAHPFLTPGKSRKKRAAGDRPARPGPSPVDVLDRLQQSKIITALEYWSAWYTPDLAAFECVARATRGGRTFTGVFTASSKRAAKNGAAAVLLREMGPQRHPGTFTATDSLVAVLNDFEQRRVISELAYSIHEIVPSRQGKACVARAVFDTQVLTGVFTADGQRAAKTGAAGALLELFDKVRSGGVGGS